MITASNLQQDNLVTQIARHLTNSIVNGEFKPGTRLNEVSLAQQFGVSRGPLREAARLLESRGLLISEPRRGFFVRTIQANELDDLFDMRVCIERHAALSTAKRLDSDGIDQLYDRVEHLEKLTQPEAQSLLVEADFLFHRKICELAENCRLLQVFDELAAEFRLVMVMYGQVHNDSEKVARSHRPIVDALAAGKRDSIVREIEGHILTNKERIVSKLTGA